MMNQRSPYAPPTSNVVVATERKGAAWKAVLLGLLVDIGGTTLAGFGASIIIFIVLGSDPSDEHQMERFSRLFDDPASPIMIGFYVMGTLFSLLGGYVCARIAKHNELKLAFVLAVLSISSGLLLDDGKTGFAMDLLLNSAAAISIFFGSWLGMKRNQHLRAPT